MPRERAPHFLRVVQALAFVSGLGPAAIVAANVAGCSSTGDLLSKGATPGAAPDACASVACGDPPGWPQGTVAYPDDASGVLAYDGQVLGVVDSGIIAFPFDGGPTGVVIEIDAGDDGALADARVDTGPPDATLIGGPLAAPELPA